MEEGERTIDFFSSFPPPRRRRCKTNRHTHTNSLAILSRLQNAGFNQNTGKKN